MNKIFISGRLVRDPELKTTASGTEFCTLTVAVDRKRRDGNGERQTDFFDVTAWSRTGVFVNQYFHKGDGINIEGRMESRKYVDGDGKNRVFWGLTVDNVEFPLSRSGGNQSAPSAADSAEFTEAADPDGDLPF